MATREGILNAAEWSFRTHGVSATTMAAIAARAGCTRGAVYWHFPDQQALLQAVIARGLPLLSPRLTEELATRQRDWLGVLQATLRRFLDDVEADPHALSVLEIVLHRCEFTGSLGQACLTVCAQEEAQVLQAFEQFFDQAQRQGELRPERSPATCASLLLLMVLGIWKARFLHNPLRPFTPDAHGALQMVFEVWRGAAAAAPEAGGPRRCELYAPPRRR
ncbi:TetR family transcriptional regulator [Corticibacter populi]|nr:TetR family transcriptional regulator [Corticibacter populi]RZS30868.1 TetR family transcriptional regulator [Corticibacter populi]